MRDTPVTYHPWLHRFSKLVVVATFALIFIGGLVTSTGSGLAVPDWPNTYGHFMFSFPISKMVGGILYEHGHRIVATIVGFLTTVLALWLWYKEPRKWVKWLGVSALITVIAQGVLGGITVLFLLPTPVSVLHACLAQTFFCLTICLAVFTSKDWVSAQDSRLENRDPRLDNLALVTTACVFLQLILGAIMRHTGSGLAIPDFPLSFGQVFPPIKTQAVAIHFLHRVGAFIVTLSVIATAVHVVRHHRHNSKLLFPTISLVTALLLQLVLAGLTIWSQKGVLPTTAHVATGAFVLGNSLFLTLRTYLALGQLDLPMKPGSVIQQATAS